MKKYTKIDGLSDSRRMPRLGKIRLGAKVEKITNPGKSNQKVIDFPVELPFFLLPDSAFAAGGKIPDIVKRAKELGVSRKDVLDFIKENGHRLAETLNVMIPVEDRNYSFPQSYKMYGGSVGLKCNGNGIEASERVGITNNWKDRKCPCKNLKTDENPKGGCSKVANLQIILPDVSMGGVYQIDIGSTNSIIDINSGIEYTKDIYEKATKERRVAMVPLLLSRVPTETHHGGSKQIHFTCRLTPVGTIATFTQLANTSRSILTHNEALSLPLPEPDYTDPLTHQVDAIYTTPENVIKMLDELRAEGEKKKNGRLRKTDAIAIKKAIDENDEAEIERIHIDVFSRQQVTGSTAADTAAKLSATSKTDKKEQSAEQQKSPV